MASNCFCVLFMDEIMISLMGVRMYIHISFCFSFFLVFQMFMGITSF